MQRRHARLPARSQACDGRQRVEGAGHSLHRRHGYDVRRHGPRGQRPQDGPIRRAEGRQPEQARPLRGQRVRRHQDGRVSCCYH